MIATDEAALCCDFLETYGLLDFKSLPARRAAIYACGLRDNSRIYQKLSGASVGLDSALLAVIADALKILIWQQTEDGRKNRNRPRSILDSLQPKENNSRGFDTAEDFDAWRASMIGGDNHG